MQAEQVVLRRHCVGPPEPSDFAVEPLDPPALREGQFRVRHCWCSVDPGTRSRLSGGDSYAAALKLGAAVDGFSVGTIVESRNPDWPEGVRVFCAGGWKTHSVQSGRGFIGRVPDVPGVPLSAWIGVLGVPGLTAWFGLRDTARFKPGDAVLVTSAAGPVGATAGQLAGAWGASRVVGIAGSTDKCRWLTEVAGFDAAIDYKAAPDLAAAVAAEFPSGVDVLFDNVGNAMVNRVLPLMTLHGRICVSGQVADYNAPPRRARRHRQHRPVHHPSRRDAGAGGVRLRPRLPRGAGDDGGDDRRRAARLRRGAVRRARRDARGVLRLVPRREFRPPRRPRRGGVR